MEVIQATMWEFFSMQLAADAEIILRMEKFHFHRICDRCKAAPVEHRVAVLKEHRPRRLPRNIAPWVALEESITPSGVPFL